MKDDDVENFIQNHRGSELGGETFPGSTVYPVFPWSNSTFPRKFDFNRNGILDKDDLDTHLALIPFVH